MIPSAVIAHTSAGRLRVKVAAYRGNAESLWALCEQLRPCPGVLTADANPVTGSVLVLHETTDDAILSFARDKGVFILDANPPRKGEPSIRRAMTATVAAADDSFRKLSSGQIDLRMASVMVLLAVGIFDITSGNFAAIPWHAAFWYALNIFLQSQQKQPA